MASRFSRVVDKVAHYSKGSVRARAFRFGVNYREQSKSFPVKPKLSPQVNKLESYFDANTEGKGIWKRRHYFNIYERHLSRFIGTNACLAEIGIYSGGSLPMWREYFGEQCKIIGIDIENACRSYVSSQIDVIIGDQSSRQFWEKFRNATPPLDIVIDDGGHEPEQQIVTLEETLPYLNAGGVYVCEDIHHCNNRFGEYCARLTSLLHGFTESPTNVLSSETNSFQKHIASIHFYPYVVVIEKHRHAVDQFTAPKHGTEWQPFL